MLRFVCRRPKVVLYLLLMGGAIIAWLVQWAISYEIIMNRPSLFASNDTAKAVYIIGATELQHPFQDVLGLSEYEASVWHSEAFLTKYVPLTRKAAQCIYGKETQADLLHGMYYFEKGTINLGLASDSVLYTHIWMKSGVLVEAGSLPEAQAIAQDITDSYRHPNRDVVFQAKIIPTDLPVQVVQLPFSDAGLQHAAFEVNGDFASQFAQDAAKLSIYGMQPRASRSLSLILFAKMHHKKEVQGVSIDRIFFGDRVIN